MFTMGSHETRAKASSHLPLTHACYASILPYGEYRPLTGRRIRRKREKKDFQNGKIL